MSGIRLNAQEALFSFMAKLYMRNLSNMSFTTEKFLQDCGYCLHILHGNVEDK